VSWYVLYADENFALAQDEYFQKQTYRNRFDILTGNGIQTLTIPVESTGGERKLLRDIRISPEYSGKKTLQAIRSAYGNSAMYDFIEIELEELFLKEEKFLIDFNVKANDWSMKWFGLHYKIPEERLAEPKILNERWKLRGKRPVELNSYPQVFSDRFTFEKDLSILDAIFNLGKTSIKTLGHVNNS
jgi:hypothetical protein